MATITNLNERVEPSFQPTPVSAAASLGSRAPGSENVASATPSSPFGGDSVRAERMELERDLARMRKTFEEMAAHGGKVDAGNQGLWKAIAAMFARMLAKIRRVLGLDPSPYEQAANAIDNATDPKEVAAAAQKALDKTADEKSTSSLTEQQANKVASLLEKSGVNALDAAVMSMVGAGCFKDVPANQKIMAGTLVAQADAIGQVRAEIKESMGAIRGALQGQMGHLNAVNLDELPLAALKQMARTAGLRDVHAECVRCENLDRDLTELTLASQKVLLEAWKTMAPLDNLQPTLDRIWTAEEQEQILAKFEEDEPEYATQRAMALESLARMAEATQAQTGEADDASGSADASPADAALSNPPSNPVSSASGEGVVNADARRALVQSIVDGRAKDPLEERLKRRSAIQAQKDRIKAAVKPEVDDPAAFAQAEAAAGQLLAHVQSSSAKVVSDAKGASAQKPGEPIGEAAGEAVGETAPESAGAGASSVQSVDGAAKPRVPVVALSPAMAALRQRIQGGLTEEQRQRSGELVEDPYQRAARIVNAFADRASQPAQPGAPVNSQGDGQVQGSAASEGGEADDAGADLPVPK